MDAPSFENLDLACAGVGKRITETSGERKELEKLITNALAVLEEQGLYALFLFLKAQDSGMANGIRKKLLSFLEKTPRQASLLPPNADDADLHNITDLDNLLLARDLVRQSLVYARYHARVPKKNEVQT
jgi:hypothetical protein